MTFPAAFSGIGQDVVAMVGRAFDHADLTDAAIAGAGSRAGDLRPLDQDAENGLVRWNQEGLAGIVQHHFEGLVAGERAGVAKSSKRRRPSAADSFCTLDRGVDHRLWPA